MDVELTYVSDRMGGIEMVKRLTKKLPSLPAIGDGWHQDGWAFTVEGRLWSEGMDKVTIFLGLEVDNPSERRRLVSNLADAGWKDLDAH